MQCIFITHQSESESHSVVSDSLQPWTIAQVPLSMEFSGYWSGQSFPSPEDLPNPGIKPRSPTLQVDFLPTEPQGEPRNTGVGSLSLLQGHLPDPGIELWSPAWQADSLPTELPGKQIHPGAQHCSNELQAASASALEALSTAGP